MTPAARVEAAIELLDTVGIPQPDKRARRLIQALGDLDAL